MLPSPEYSERLVEQRYKVHGYRLKSLCLGHVLLLERLGSPFADPTMIHQIKPGRGDLILGLLICSRTYAKAKRLSESKWILIRLLIEGWWSTIRWPGITHLLPIADFKAYLSNAWAGPIVWPESKSGKPAGAPFFGQLKVILCTDFGKSEQEAMETKIKEVIWDAAIHAERTGALRIFGKSDSDQVEIAKHAAANPFPFPERLPV